MCCSYKALSVPFHRQPGIQQRPIPTVRHNTTIALSTLLLCWYVRCSAVTRFARATGDVAALSTVDIKLLALVHTLEVAAYGAGHLSTHPNQVRHAHLRTHAHLQWFKHCAILSQALLSPCLHSAEGHLIAPAFSTHTPPCNRLTLKPLGQEAV